VTAPRDHARDAGGDPALLATKAALRHEVWEALRAAGAARFPGANGRIPNFVGAEAAAERLRTTPAWRDAATVKANPDSPQLPVRQRALEDGKTVLMAAPRLAADEPFFLLDPATIHVAPRKAASINGASSYGRPVGIDGLEPVDLVVTGCVAVAADGARLGKGGGFSDLEYAIGWEAGLIGPSTVVATTVHEAQVLRRGRIPVTEHDFRLDLIVTPHRIITCSRAGRTRGPAPSVHWDELTGEKIAAIPLLGRLRGA
jgi:5-formyltetrahydrofolate cyclo-ligase